ncbi:MAG: hypothetical protein U0175_02940 [Caldilineaceae bacterium]
MLRKRNLGFTLVALLLMVTLVGCTASAVKMPTRTISITQQDAIDGQNAAMSGLLSGKVEWTENQFSSLISGLLTSNSGPNMPVTAIHAWFEPNNEIYLRVVLKPHVLRAGETLDLAGKVNVENKHVVVNLQQAGMGNMSVSDLLLSTISGQINSVLAGANFGVAASVQTASGTLTVKLGS